MSMSIRCDGCGLEYAGGKGIGGLFAQPRSMARPAYLRMLVEVKRFHGDARRVLATGDDSQTLAQFLAAGGYSTYFIRHFMVPFVSCVWSTSADAALHYPARYLFVFLANHGALSVSGSHDWRTVVGGSGRYVEKVAKGANSVRLTTPVRAITRHAGGVTVHDDDGEAEDFRHVVVATHADTALGLLAAPTAAEQRALSAFGYSRNDTLLHTDDRILPVSPRARASWNYLMPTCTTSSGDVVVSYDMNRLQQLPTATPHIVTLNATERIETASVIASMRYEHPIYTVDSVAAQRLLPGLNDGRLAFAGAYHGWGFHEDGCRAGVEAAASLGVQW
jgi:predicted NAD/FAD-binding protein